MRPTRRLLAASGVVALLAGTLAAAGQPRQLPRLFAIPSLTGRDNFDFYCSGCHGMDARGDGPLAAGMSPHPPNLTLLARANGGAFPRDRITSSIRHGASQGHPTADMPNWWSVFTGLDPSDARAIHRIDNVVEYIESLQVPSSGPDDPGARLFRAHCATCHGEDARGGGPLAQVRHPMPDLTGFALENGGVFPSARVYRIIEGRDIDAHGSPEMPAWGHVFRRDGADASAARGRIDALVKYLAAIQRRAG